MAGFIQKRGLIYELLLIVEAENQVCKLEVENKKQQYEEYKMKKNQ
jgi:hypothetical protein